MKEDPNNNILHNFQKDVIIAGLTESPKVRNILFEEIAFEDTLKSNLSNINSKLSFEAQLFLIA